jgi:hypothetical protein
MDRPRKTLVTIGLATTAAIALLCSGLAVWASEVGCGSTDGSFRLDDSLARPSGFCRDTHFPGFPNTTGSALLVIAIYLTPVAVMVFGTVATALTGRRRILYGAFWITALLTVAVVIFTSQADVGYAGV